LTSSVLGSTHCQAAATGAVFPLRELVVFVFWALAVLVMADTLFSISSSCRLTVAGRFALAASGLVLNPGLSVESFLPRENRPFGLGPVFSYFSVDNPMMGGILWGGVKKRILPSRQQSHSWKRFAQETGCCATCFDLPFHNSSCGPVGPGRLPAPLPHEIAP